MIFTTLLSALLLAIVSHGFAQDEPPRRNFTAQGRHFYDAYITAIEGNIVMIEHSAGSTGLHRGVVPKQLFDDYEAAKNPPPKDSLIVKAKIIQILEGGALAEVAVQQTVERTRTKIVGGTALDRPREIAEKYRETIFTPHDKPVFIYGVPHDLVDGETWIGRIYGSGTYRYTAVNGAAKTVRAFATSKELGLKHLKK